jgi:hypothetical protein
MLALHLLQSSLVFINTQLLQAVLRDPAWAGRLTEEDRRGLAPLFGSTSTPTGGSASTWIPASTSPPPDAGVISSPLKSRSSTYTGRCPPPWSLLSPSIAQKTGPATTG